MNAAELIDFLRRKLTDAMSELEARDVRLYELDIDASKCRHGEGHMTLQANIRLIARAPAPTIKS